MLFHQYKSAFIHIPKTAGVSIRNTLDETLPHEHLPASEIKSRLGGKEYTVFTVIRNPLDRMVSAYHYLKQYKPKIMPSTSFEEWVFYTKKNWGRLKLGPPEADHIYPTQTHWLNADLPIKILRFERLIEDWEELAHQINAPTKLLHINASIHEQWIKYYTVDTIKIVIDLYQQDMERFDYSPPKMLL
jgi:hypothetical protein